MNKNFIECNNIYLSLNERVILQDLNFSYSGQLNASLIGLSGCGKTTLLKLFDQKNKIPYKGKITINKKISIIFEEEIEYTGYLYYLLNMDNISSTKKCFYELFLGFSDFYVNYNGLNYLLKKKVEILMQLNTRPNLIIFDDILREFSENARNILINYIKTNNIRFINVTSNIEEVILADYLYVMSDQIIMQGNRKEILNKEKVLKRLGFSLPFIFDLTRQLKYYNLLDTALETKEELVGSLWNK